MRTILLPLGMLCAVVVLVGAEDATIVSQESDVKADGSYKFAYELSNGIAASEEGQGGISAHGSYSYMDPQGNLISVTYTADENGFRPVGDHLPTAPPIPDLIARALEYLRSRAPESEQEHFPALTDAENSSTRTTSDPAAMPTTAVTNLPLLLERNEKEVEANFVS